MTNGLERSSAGNTPPSGDNIVLFHPHIPATGIGEIASCLATRWVGQGPRVDDFERRFSDKFAAGRTSVATGSGTDALHLAYILAGIGEGDEVVTPVFTCTATNIPLLYQRALPVFADVQPHSLNIDPAHVRRLMTERTKAIVCVHYGGLPCDMDELTAISVEWGVPIIQDAAHAVGGRYREQDVAQLSEFSIFSFQAIKHITTGDGGMLVLADANLRAKANRIRWFGIDRAAKQGGIWNNDIRELGYKYQMTDMAASLGLAGLKEIDATLALRRRLLQRYVDNLQGMADVRLIGAGYADREHAAWMCTVEVHDRSGLQRKLHENGVESDPVHYRNDRYEVFGQRKGNLPNMDAMEDRYLVLPLHTKMACRDVDRICAVIRSGW